MEEKKRRREGLRRGVRVSWLALVILTRSGLPSFTAREAYGLLTARLRLTDRQVRNLLSLLVEQGLLQRTRGGYTITPEGFALAERLLSPLDRWLVEVDGDRIVTDYATASHLLRKALESGVKRTSIKRLRG